MKTPEERVAIMRRQIRRYLLGNLRAVPMALRDRLRRNGMVAG